VIGTERLLIREWRDPALPKGHALQAHITYVKERP
jgi:hypothetical protein